MRGQPRITTTRLAVLFLFGLLQPQALATSETESEAKLTILAWNVESGGNDPQVIAKQLRQLRGFDIACLNEVRSVNFELYTEAAGPHFKSVVSKTGRGDRLVIIYNHVRFELLQQQELHRYGDHELNNGYHRSPLFVRLKERVKKTEFIVMTNHLSRTMAELRNQQAIGLREWARDQTVPVINIGDFNMDFDFRTEQGNEAFTEMLRDNVWMWVRPKPLIDTNWADHNGDGEDDYPDSMLDFAFVAGAAKEWEPTCRVIVRDGDFPDDDTTSDHRPIELRVTMGN